MAAPHPGIPSGRNHLHEPGLEKAYTFGPSASDTWLKSAGLQPAPPPFSSPYRSPREIKGKIRINTKASSHKEMAGR